MGVGVGVGVGVIHDLGVTAHLMLFRLTRDPHVVLILLPAGLNMGGYVCLGVCGCESAHSVSLTCVQAYHIRSKCAA